MEDDAVVVEDRDEEQHPIQALDRIPPTNVDQLSSLPGSAHRDIIAARETIIATLRMASLRATYPTDYVAFKSPDGAVVLYLQDAGCHRVRDLWGIEIYGVSKPEKVAGEEPGTFHYIVTGNGRCRITGQTVEGVEGGRSSTDDFCRGKHGAELDMDVRKAARANLNGNATRELAGLKAIPIEELERAWQGTSKKVSQCRLGRGFGSQAERFGASPAGVPDVPPPVCGVCKAIAVYRPATSTRGAFYGCPSYQQHPNQKWIQDADKWIAQQTKAAAAMPPRETGQEG
jgi:hypothetical protein